MRRTIDHLSIRTQVELNQAVSHLVEGLRADLVRAGQETALHGRILKVVRYGLADGSGKDDVAAEVHDLLVLVSDETLMEPSLWREARERIAADRHIRRPVIFVVHPLADMFAALKAGVPFFCHAIAEGVLLYDWPSPPIPEPGALDPVVALQEVRRHGADWLRSADGFLLVARRNLKGHRNLPAALHLHQAAEHLYLGVLWMLQLHAPPTHSLADLRRRAEALAPSLTQIWPRETPQQRRLFGLLREAFDQAGRSRGYVVGADDLRALDAQVDQLRAAFVDIHEQEVGRLTQIGASDAP
jgi:hypothetical protein